MIQFSIPRTILAVLVSFLVICFWPVESYSDPLGGTAEEAGLRIATEAREGPEGFRQFHRKPDYDAT